MSRVYKNEEIFRGYLVAARNALANPPGRDQCSGAEPDRQSRFDDWVSVTECRLQQTSDKLGWAAKNLKPEDLCWNPGTFRCDRCGSEADYILPRTIRILARVKGADGSAICDWTLETPQSPPPTARAPCDGDDRALARFDAPYSADASAKSTLSVRVSPEGGGAAPTVPPATVQLRDYLIVGMGDSFGAGVGNPDKPAEMENAARNAVDYGHPWAVYGPRDDPARRYLPVRAGLVGSANGGYGQARWLDIRCYRSQYGPQFRAALQLAAALPHASVTFLDFACNGATVLQGLLAEKPLGSGFAANLAPVPAQLGEVARLVCDRRTTNWKRAVRSTRFAPDACKRKDSLCVYPSPNLAGTSYPQRVNLFGCSQDYARRPIDYVLLSIGGNDIGFASLVANEALIGGTIDALYIRSLLHGLVGAVESGAEAVAQLAYLQELYFHLNDAIGTLLPMRRGGDSSSRILLAGYPLPDAWRGGVLCGEDVAGSKRADDTMDGFAFLGAFTDPNAAFGPQKRSIVLDVHAGACALDVQRSRWMNGDLDPDRSRAEAFMSDRLCRGAPDVAESPVPALPWSYVTGFVEKSWPHGYCAGAAEAEAACGGDPRSARCADESAKIPAFETRRSTTTIPYSVAAFWPFHSRERWFRTFNDAYLTTNWQVKRGQRDSIVNAVGAFATSAMHPTAEGYAKIADSYVKAMLRAVCGERTEAAFGASEAADARRP